MILCLRCFFIDLFKYFISVFLYLNIGTYLLQYIFHFVVLLFLMNIKFFIK